MPALDITTLTRAADEALTRVENPLHRQILENYRRHAILEVVGRWQEIFTPEMTVEHPVYHVTGGGRSLTLDGYEQVTSFYRALEHSQTTVMVLQDEQLAVADWGFASEAWFNSYVSGAVALALHRAGAGGFDADPEAFYLQRRLLMTHWPYDPRGRMIGEHVMVHDDLTTITEIPQEEFVTLQEAQEKLTPLLRPLPVFEPA